MAQMPDAARAACAPLQEFKKEGPVRLRAIWISDLHLGTPGCQAKHVLDFLRCTESKQLYLVGDIVDGWQLRRRWYWPQAHNDVVQKVLRKARHGTRVVFIPGNHDEFVRHFLELSFGGIEICDEAEHLTAGGRRLLVRHGDLFDAVVQRARWLAILGDHLHVGVLHLNRWLNSARPPRVRVLVARPVPQAQDQERGELHLRLRARGGVRGPPPRLCGRRLRPHP